VRRHGTGRAAAGDVSQFVSILALVLRVSKS